MFCYFCGKENSEIQRFCKYCGKSLHPNMKISDEPTDELKSVSVEAHLEELPQGIEKEPDKSVDLTEEEQSESEPLSDDYTTELPVTEEMISEDHAKAETVVVEQIAGIPDIEEPDEEEYSEEDSLSADQPEEMPIIEEIETEQRNKKRVNEERFSSKNKTTNKKTSGINKVLIAVIAILSVVLVALVAFLVIYLKGGLPGLKKDQDTVSEQEAASDKIEDTQTGELYDSDEAVNVDENDADEDKTTDDKAEIKEDDRDDEPEDEPAGGEITDSDWQEAYRKLLKDSIDPGAMEDDRAEAYYVYDIDKDDIPELIVQYGTAEASKKGLIYGIDKETKKTVQLGDTWIGHSSLNTYPNGNGIVRDMCHMSCQAVDRIYVDNGKISENTILEEVEYDWIDEFYKDIDEIVRGSLYIEPTKIADDSAITGYRDHIKEKASMKNKDIHRYEIFTEDITWTEAWERCRQKGGYLARIDTKEENDHICNLLNSKGLTGIAYIGGRREDNGDDTIFYHWVGDDGELYDYDINYYEYERFWLEGEPSYHDEVNGQQIDEKYMCLIYIKSQGKWLWNDISNDVLSLSPKYYKGKISYVCEFE